MRKNLLYPLIFLMIGLSVGSCTDDSKGKKEIPAEVNTLTIENVSDDHWLYFSFESGQVIGSSKLLDEAEDAAWAKRTDWDIAICGDLIRTNSGTSGNGEGGIQNISNRSFNAIEEAPVSGYQEDTREVVIKK